jgi:hypothetical protein
MATLRLLGILTGLAMASAADLHIAIVPGEVVERRLTFSNDDLAKEPLLWVQADPDQIVVSVISPDGHVYSGASPDDSAAVVIHFADRKSSSQDELGLGQVLDTDATLVGLKKNAPAGVYKIRLERRELSSVTEVTVHQTTSDGLAQEILAKVQKSAAESIASLYAAPKQLAKFDAHGQAKLILTGTWQKDDIILMGATADGAWTAAIGLPDGATVTEANAKASGCDWRWSDSDQTMMNPLPEVHGKLLAVACPERMQNGPITITAQTGDKNAGGQLIAVVLRPSNIGAQWDRNLSAAGQTVALRSKPEGASTDGNHRSAVVDRPIVIRLELDGGLSPIAEVAVSGQAYLVDGKHVPPVNVFGPDPAKKLYGTIAKIARDPNGDFVYTFKTQEAGIHQLDFKAEGVFQNGRRFAADTIVTVYVHRLAARLTGIRQQRMAGVAHFLLDLDVTEPGPYTADVEISNGPNQDRSFVFSAKMLESGKQTMIVDSDAKFFAKLLENPKAQLMARMELRWEPKEGDAPREIVIDTAIPKAGEFETRAPGRSGTNATGVTWSVSSSGLALTVPVFATGTGCQWAGTLEINPAQTRPNESIRTVGYREAGTFVPKDGKATIESRWSLEPFFTGGPVPATQAFIFRLKELRCGENRGYVNRFEINPEPTSDMYTMPFSADLKGLPLWPLADPGPAETLHVVGPVTIEPLDQDGDGKFDHLKASFDLASPGGHCAWTGYVTMEGRGFGANGSADTMPGVGAVSMEIDATSSFSLRDRSIFSFQITMIKCGAAGTQITGDEMNAAFLNHTVLVEQQFAIDSHRFAALGEFKPR